MFFFSRDIQTSPGCLQGESTRNNQRLYGSASVRAVADHWSRSRWGSVARSGNCRGSLWIHVLARIWPNQVCARQHRRFCEPMGCFSFWLFFLCFASAQDVWSNWILILWFFLGVVCLLHLQKWGESVRVIECKMWDLARNTKTCDLPKNTKIFEARAVKNKQAPQKTSSCASPWHGTYAPIPIYLLNERYHIIFNFHY
jgi:hypothetical protein